MPRINIDENFWFDVGMLSAKVGNFERATGMAALFLRLAQDRYRTHRVLLDSDFGEGPGQHSPHLIDIFCEPLEGGGYQYKHADAEFGWLIACQKNGAKGGRTNRLAPEGTVRQKRVAVTKVNQAVKSGELVRPTHCEACGKEGKIQGHHTDYSKPLDVQWLCPTCHRSQHRGTGIQGVSTKPEHPRHTEKNPLTLPLPLPLTQTQIQTTKASAPPMHWLAVAWNEYGGTLPKVKEVNADRRKLIEAALKECSDQAEWVRAIKRVAASDHCNGKSKPKVEGNAPWVARFDWFLRAGSRTKALEGLYDNKTQPTPKPAPVAAPRKEPERTPEERAAAARAAQEFAARFVRGPTVQQRRGVTNSWKKTMENSDEGMHTPEEVRGILENQFGSNAEHNEGEENASQRIGFDCQPQDQEFPEHRGCGNQTGPGNPDRREE